MLTAADQGFEAFRARLQEMEARLPKRLKQCADFIIANPDRLAFGTVAQIAAAAGVQPSAVVRFAKVMGYSGYSDLQQVFRDRLGPPRLDYVSRIAGLKAAGGDAPETQLAEVIEAGRDSLDALAQSNETTTLEAAVEAIAAADVVHLVGYRRAFSVSSYLTYAFDKLGMAAIQHGGTGQLSSANAIRPQDALIAITYAPYTEATLNLARTAAESGAKVIGITDSLASPLHDIAAVTFDVAEVDVGSFRSISATFALAITLAVAVGAARSEG